MSKQDADVRITTSIDLSDFAGRLQGEVLDIFEDAADTLIQNTRASWDGWKYKGRDLRTVGRSRAAWHHTIKTQDGIREIRIQNNARGAYYRKRDGVVVETRKGYAAHVVRKKGDRREWTIIQEMLTVDLWPVLVERLQEAIARGFATTGRRVEVRQDQDAPVEWVVERSIIS